ncbi:hypothetical protein LZ32DRAFT_430172 [Colletotrichum eremochloae]|nr:hypothetical protein LZ32DRAFT_430172 [Colletotrichum eremochloae]
MGAAVSALGPGRSETDPLSSPKQRGTPTWKEWRPSPLATKVSPPTPQPHHKPVQLLHIYSLNGIRDQLHAHAAKLCVCNMEVRLRGRQNWLLGVDVTSRRMIYASGIYASSGFGAHRAGILPIGPTLPFAAHMTRSECLCASQYLVSTVTLQDVDGWPMLDSCRCENNGGVR